MVVKLHFPFGLADTLIGIIGHRTTVGLWTVSLSLALLCVLAALFGDEIAGDLIRQPDAAP
jgi:hypothetical protein